MDSQTSYLKQSMEFVEPTDTELNRMNDNLARADQSRLSFKTPVSNDRPKIQIIDIVSYIWLFVVLVLLSRCLASYIIIKGKLRHAVLLRNNIYETDRVSTPFVLGFLQPKIYLPLHLEPEEMLIVLRHEQTHIRRRDYLIKPLAYMALLLHWFNPLMWLSFILMEKDMEMSCDESVMKHAKDDIRIKYTQTLLSLSVKQNHSTGKALMVSPLPFGEGNVKNRIKNVLRYKKRKFWINALTIVVLLTISISLITNTLKSDKLQVNPKRISEETKSFGIGDKDVNESKIIPSPSNPTVAPQISEMVNENLSIIMSSPRTSSNPQDYIEAHRENYENIIKYGGENALKYLLAQFETGENNDLQGHIMMSLCKDLLGERNNVKDDSLSPQEWYNSLSIREESKVPDFVYSGTNTIDKLVYSAAMQQYSQEDNGFTVVAPTIYDYFMSGNKLKIFVTVYSNSFKLYDKTLSETGGSIIPAAITYSKNKDGSYQLEEYLEASDGVSFASSIKEYCTLPDSKEKIDGLAQRIMEDCGSNEERSQLLFKNLKEHLLANQYMGITLKQSDNTLIPIT
jgi:beta-lactamase regulating signal transducer with metallopeptidase domain